MAWSNIHIFDNQIKYAGDRASLIKLPGTTTCFWLSAKCIRSGKTWNSYSIGINDEWDYHTVDGQQKDVITGDELLSYFENQAPIYKKQVYQKIHHMPEEIQPLKNRDVPDDLRR